MKRSSFFRALFLKKFDHLLSEISPLPERFFTYFCDCKVVLAVVFWGDAAMDDTV
jgi:hypothetical protein